ncbi:hypothetical protein E2721_24120 [Salmonella enterica]|nr:hypothetical protein [Salmonella enterica]
MRWPSARCRRRRFYDLPVFSKLQQNNDEKRQSVFLMNAVAAVRYVKSDKKAGGVAVIFCVAQAKKSPSFS